MINTLYNYFKRIKFNKTETFQLLVMILVVGFILGINDGRPTNELDLIWFKNFIAAMLSSSIVFFSFVVFVKMVSYWRGYYAEYVWNPLPLVFSVFLSFLTFGKMIFFLPGGFNFKVIQHRRLGKFRHGPMFIEKAVIALISIFFVLFIGMITKSFTDSLLSNNLFHLSLYFALYAVLPIPFKSLGLDILTYSVPFFTFSLILVFITTTLLYFLEPGWAITFGIIGTIIAFNKIKDKL
ncbi:MAG: hypothetical protein PWP03_251 [Candidatus Woesearchaeota archaeon]|nr:hypothetical protein [Candidatus Woesearchaeota archaeon]MDN5327613.1 hypothetical protein [Candidatus Woesearchaeota archaeon]